MAENEENISADAPESSAAPEDNASAATETTTDASAADGSESHGTPATEADAAPEEPQSTEEITYHAVEKDGQVTAIWEMQGRKHLRTIDPRSRQGADILRLYTAEHPDDPAVQEAQQ